MYSWTMLRRAGSPAEADKRGKPLPAHELCDALFGGIQAGDVVEFDNCALIHDLVFDLLRGRMRMVMPFASRRCVRRAHPTRRRRLPR